MVKGITDLSFKIVNKLTTSLSNTFLDSFLKDGSNNIFVNYWLQANTIPEFSKILNDDSVIKVNLNAGTSGDFIFPVIKRGETDWYSDLDVQNTYWEKGEFDQRGKEAKKHKGDPNYKVIDTDLTTGTGSGDFIHFFYKKGGSNPITDLIFRIGSNPPEILFGHYHLINVDLNKNAKGEYIYAYKTTNSFEEISLNQGGIPKKLLQNPDRKFCVSSVQLNARSVVFRYIQTKVQSIQIAAGSKLKRSFKKYSSSTTKEIEDFTKSIGFEAGLEIKVFSAKINGSMSWSNTKEFESINSTEETIEYEPSLSDYPKIITYTEVLDILECKDPSTGATKSSITSVLPKHVFDEIKESH